MDQEWITRLNKDWKDLQSTLEQSEIINTLNGYQKQLEAELEEAIAQDAHQKQATQEQNELCNTLAKRLATESDREISLLENKQSQIEKDIKEINTSIDEHRIEYDGVSKTEASLLKECDALENELDLSQKKNEMLLRIQLYNDLGVTITKPENGHAASIYVHGNQVSFDNDSTYKNVNKLWQLVQ